MSASEESPSGKLVLSTAEGEDGNNKTLCNSCKSSKTKDNCCSCCGKSLQPKSNEPSRQQLLKQQAKNSARQAQVACQQALVAAEQSRIATLLANSCKKQEEKPKAKQIVEIHTHPCSDCGSNQNNDSNKIVLDASSNSGVGTEKEKSDGGKSEQGSKPESKTNTECSCGSKKNKKKDPCHCRPCQQITIKPGSNSSESSFVISVKKPHH